MYLPNTLAARLAGALLKGVGGAIRVGRRGRGLGEDGAEIEEVLLGGTALGEGAALPLSDERGHIETW